MPWAHTGVRSSTALLSRVWGPRCSQADEAYLYLSIPTSWSDRPEPHVVSLTRPRVGERVVARRLTALGAMLPRPFITLFAQHRPRALVLTAQFFALKKSMEQHWWLRGTADHDVRGIQSLLPQNWQWAMEWPLATLKTFSGMNYTPLANGVGGQMGAFSSHPEDEGWARPLPA